MAEASGNTGKVKLPKGEVEGKGEKRGSGICGPSEARHYADLLGFSWSETLQEVSPPQNLRCGEFSRIVGSWGRHHRAIPFSSNEKEIWVALSDPLNSDAVEILEHCYGKPAKVVVVPDEEITKAINSIRTSLMSDRDNSLEATDEKEGEEISQSLKIDVTDAEDDDAPIIRYVNTLIFRAASQRASDIHIEPSEDCLKVRFRVDGVLKDVDKTESVFQSAILSRVKVMANLNIAEKRLPQDGRIGIKIAGQDVDIRISTIPTRFGERIVMRLLDKSKMNIDIDYLGLTPENRRTLESVIVKNHGIILVTGPTGSGKTTTLYASLQKINSPDKNILTVEDPIEYELKGVGQMQVNPKIDFTFAKGLRSILRQDPDVIMIGEIRDLETVEIAIQASLTGHLVFSTLHTNDAPGAVTRLLDMGVEPFLISSSLLVVIAQRLVRTLCPHCKVPVEFTKEKLCELKLRDYSTLSHGLKTYMASEEGCNKCNGHGYLGRCGIHEMLIIDDAVRNLIMQRANASQIRAAATNIKNLREDGVTKVIQGITSFEEVVRVTQEDIIE